MELETTSKRLDVSPANLERVAAQMLALPQADMPLRHHFAPGVCIRELTMPAGTLVIGHFHRFADLNIMLTGRLTLLNADGSTKELTAPQTFVSQPGQKVAYIHEDVIWQNVWATKVNAEVDLGNDVEAIEDFYLDQSRVWVADQAQRLAIERLARQADRESFADFLRFNEMPAEDVRRISESKADQMPLPPGSWQFRVGDSAIEGQGLLATAPIAAGEVIAPARINGQRTPAGRYTNHAEQPNAEIISAQNVPPGWELVLIATRDIAGATGGRPGEEITVNYHQVLQANNSLAVELAKRKEIL